MPPEEGSACNRVGKRLGDIVSRREILRFAQNDGNVMTDHGVADAIVES
jgi:hypothetical protein